ncbi:MAG: hypothetical protein IPM37_13775 [Hahellaceae bacterium]|nr:hypothetical protein [Hahellaceae bacterium]
MRQGDFPSETLFTGVANEVNKALSVRSYRHRGPFRRQSLTDNNGADVTKAIFQAVEIRISQLIKDKPTPSNQNWRLTPQLNKWNPRNPEVNLERRLVSVRQTQDWWNQVPVASGLIGSSGRRGCIDLVHKRDRGIFDFVELKVASDTPIFAAVEILQYGFAWLLSRFHRDNLGYSRKTESLLDGNEVNLFVLAPRDFYRDISLDRFQIGIREALMKIANQYDAAMSFNFAKFDMPSPDCNEVVLRDLLDNIFSN